MEYLGGVMLVLSTVCQSSLLYSRMYEKVTAAPALLSLHSGVEGEFGDHDTVLEGTPSPKTGFPVVAVQVAKGFSGERDVVGTLLKTVSEEVGITQTKVERLPGITLPLPQGVPGCGVASRDTGLGASPVAAFDGGGGLRGGGKVWGGAPALDFEECAITEESGALKDLFQVFRDFSVSGEIFVAGKEGPTETRSERQHGYKEGCFQSCEVPSHGPEYTS